MEPLLCLVIEVPISLIAHAGFFPAAMNRGADMTVRATTHTTHTTLKQTPALPMAPMRRVNLRPRANRVPRAIAPERNSRCLLGR